MIRVLSILFVVITNIFIFLPECCAGDILYYVYDKPGKSVTTIVDSSQEIVNAYSYGGFGNVNLEIENKTNVYKYNAEQADSKTNFIFLRNRYYDPSLGRFITKDIFPGIKEIPQTLNSYVYVNNNPVNRIDPTGEFEPVTITVLTAGAIAALDMWSYRATEWYFNKRYGSDL